MSKDPQWAVWIQGPDDILPALGRADAFERANTANTAIAWNETHHTPSNSDAYLPLVWAMPCQYGPGSPIGEVGPAWTAEQVEAAWKRWAE
ncbi:hypothetical protein [Nocardia australiensis]|uniref:hypothetical protein n=1 Tax=Nocardia australiensis TaxID=2887191 RepID=UPI001D136C7C|nr:hypothetical protein [Nocardia australiensis]